jgi:predicted GH43/DUF377 family glycosyl hydrolase
MKFQLDRYPDNQNPKPILVPRQGVEWESKAVFNPSVVYDQGFFRMLYRTYPKNLEMGAPRLNRPGYYFKNQVSYIGYAESKDGINFERKDNPFISPDTDCDRYGCEDPRVTKIGDTFYITYTAIDGPLEDRERRPNVRVALATTKDFITIKKHGIIGPSARSKAAAFFPEPVKKGKIGLLMSVSSDSANSRVVTRYYDSIDDALRTSSDDWNIFLNTDRSTLKTEWWLHRGPELGAAPIKTDRGWLLIFSAESMSDTWTIGAALLDINDPDKLIARTSGYILQPATNYERDGLVPNVTFPEGAVIVGDKLYVYYGAADTVIGLATCKLNNLLDYIESFKIKI